MSDLRHRAAAIGVNLDDLLDFIGDIELGPNGTGVINSSIHFTGDEIIIKEEMPAPYVQEIIDQVAAFGNRCKERMPGGDLAGSIPLPLWHAWRREWERTAKQHGVIWRAFFNSKFMDRDFSKFRVKR